MVYEAPGSGYVEPHFLIICDILELALGLRGTGMAIVIFLNSVTISRGDCSGRKNPFQVSFL